MFGIVYGAGFRQRIVAASKLIYRAIGAGALKFIRFLIEGSGLLSQTGSSAIQFDWSEGFDVDLNDFIDRIEDSLDLPIDIPDLEQLKFHIPGFGALVEYLSPGLNVADVWLSLGFGPSSLIPVSEWIADAAGYLVRPDVLGSALLGDIVTIICPIIGLPRMVIDVLMGIGETMVGWNNIANDYNRIRMNIILALEQGRDGIAKALSVLRTTLDASEAIESVSQYLSLDAIRDWADNLGLSESQEFQDIMGDADSVAEVLHQLSSNLESYLSLLLNDFDITLEQLLEKFDSAIDFIESQMPLLPNLEAGWLDKFKDAFYWDMFPQEDENSNLGGQADYIVSSWAIMAGSLFGFTGLFLVNYWINQGVELQFEPPQPPEILDEEEIIAGRTAVSSSEETPRPENPNPDPGGQFW
jgi:hypothetical protein